MVSTVWTMGLLKLDLFFLHHESENECLLISFLKTRCKRELKHPHSPRLQLYWDVLFFRNKPSVDILLANNIFMKLTLNSIPLDPIAAVTQFHCDGAQRNRQKIRIFQYFDCLLLSSSREWKCNIPHLFIRPMACVYHHYILWQIENKFKTKPMPCIQEV